MTLFELRGVGFAVAGRNVLDAVNATVVRANVVGLIGQNGSGKSSLLKIMARQQSPSTGEVLFAGRPLNTWKDRALARRLAYLPQDPPRDTGLLVRELVAFGRYPWHGALGRFGATDDNAVAEALSMTDVVDLSSRAVDSLSGGERQRVWLSMLMAQQADCLLLDEPTSALDIAHQLDVLALVRRLAHERSRGIVVVLHDVNLAARFCDEIVALCAGRIVASGPPDAIMRPEVLEQIYGVELDVMKAGGRTLAFAR